MARLNQAPDDHTLRCEYDSIDELAEVAASHIYDRYPDGMGTVFDDDLADAYSVRSPREAFELARDGWADLLPDTLDLMRDAVTTVEAERDEITFVPEWSVSGGMVDMGAYLAGEPECMIEFPPSKTTRNGRVITMCASISVSGGVSAKRLILKGQVVAALALALERMGMSTELYADLSAESYTGRSRWYGIQRVLVKGTGDVLDPARVLFAYAHPAMLRVLGLTAMHDYPFEWQMRMHVGTGYGLPHPPARDLPEGTIYLPETLYGDKTDAPGYIESYLRELGLVS